MENSMKLNYQSFLLNNFRYIAFDKFLEASTLTITFDQY